MGIEQVGIHDSFFELGGDSVISIQFIARANKAGLRLTPKQVFEYQTVAELAGAAGTTEVMQAEQGIVQGPVPLTPIQRRFFEQHTTDEHHFNQSFMFEVREALPPSLVERTLQYLLGHHDALRLSITRGGGGWEQFNAGFDGATPFTCVDLSNLSGGRQTAALEAAAAATQGSLDLKAGPLVRLVLVDLGAGQPMRLLIVIHHLAVDGVSWRILLEDMQTIFNQLKAGQPIDIGLKTTSLKAWAERLAGYASSVESERAYWLDARRERVTGLPVDYPESLNSEASARTVSVSLTAEETQALLQEVPQAFHTQINEVLMTALVQSCAAWTGMRSMVVDMEGHGREAIFEDVDLSRTVGWFTTVFPVLLDIEEAATPLDALRLVKESLRAVPNRGLGYGVTRYLSPDAEVRERLGRLPQAE
ncbi:MAG: condensation domain-containing protein, partial [Acidobacteria bacterium]|nr:condensation domain-containing protein [Acidobacteriota bacterium]